MTNSAYFFFWLENSNEEYKRIFFLTSPTCKIATIKTTEHNRTFMFLIDFCSNQTCSSDFIILTWEF